MKPNIRSKHWVVPVGIAFLSAALTPLRAQDYDPEQAKRAVARISVLNGDVSVKRGDADVVAAAPNTPLVTEDRIYSGPGSRAEVQFDYANLLRMAGDTEVRLAQLEAGHFVLQIARGTVQFSVLQDGQRSDVEIDTPSISVRPVARGEYRVTVLEDGTTQATVRAGQAEVFSPRGSQRLDPGRTMLVRGNQSEPEFQLISEIRMDAFDQWVQSRNQELEARANEEYRYVPRDVYGAEDLAGNGQWVYEQPYGYVWAPNVPETWAPYRYGRWSWLDWYGWSWVSNDSWGWAPYHYGRWFHGGHGWCWYPGAIGARHYWSPALVAFVGFGGGGVGFGVSFGGGWGNVGWIPLAPHEVYHPWWGYGHGGHGFNQTNIVNNVNVVNNYRNARVVNGITAVSATNFGRGGSANYVRVSGEQIRGASVVHGALPVAPGRESLRVADREPARAVRTADSVRSFYSPRPVANTASRVPFEQQRQTMQEITRQTFGGASMPGRNATDVRVLPSTREPQRPTPTVRTPDNGNSWRRFGDPAAFRSVTGETPRGGAATEPRNQAGQATSWTSPQESRANTWRSESPRGWGTGDTIRVNPPIVRDRPSEAAPRYQAPQTTAPAYQAPRYQAPQLAPRYQAPRSSAPSYQAPRSSGGSSSRSAGFSGGGGGGRSSAPSGGRSGGGGGGGGGGSRGGGGSHR